jgi:hypothetical protein
LTIPPSIAHGRRMAMRAHQIASVKKAPYPGLVILRAH